jgi:hypothetical protein
MDGFGPQQLARARRPCWPIGDCLQIALLWQIWPARGWDSRIGCLVIHGWSALEADHGWGNTGLDKDVECWLRPFLGRLGHATRRRMCPVYVSGLIGPGDRAPEEVAFEEAIGRSRGGRRLRRELRELLLRTVNIRPLGSPGGRRTCARRPRSSFRAWSHRISRVLTTFSLNAQDCIAPICS